MSATAAAGPALLGIHHFTIRCAPAALDAVRAFYCEVLGMATGPRPDFPFDGHWLYVGETAVVHLAAVLAEKAIFDLRGPVIRVTGYDVPYPYWQIEDAYMPSVERVVDAARRVLAT